MSGDAEDRRELKRIVDELYRSVSAPAGHAPPIHLETPLLHPRARMCRTVRDAEGRARFQIMTGEEFAESVRRLVTERGFFEVEIRHESFVYGAIAHVLSHYEAFADEARTRRVKKGVNSIQLLELDGRWTVFSMIWDDEESAIPVPEPVSPRA